MPVMQRSIIVHRLGYSTPSQPDRMFHIYIMSGVCGGANGIRPGRLHDQYTCCNERGFQYSGLGIPILDCDNRTVAELVDNNLYVLFDQYCHSHSCDWNPARAFHDLISAVADYLQKPEDERASDEEARRKRRQDDSNRRLVEHLSDVVHRQLSDQDCRFGNALANEQQSMSALLVQKWHLAESTNKIA